MTQAPDMNDTAGEPLASPGERPRPLLYWAAVALLLVSCVYFTVRGPVRGWSFSIDFHAFYSSTRAWIEGSDPYDLDNLRRVLIEGGDKGDVRPFYNPPLIFPLLAPLGALPWPVAEKAWTILNVLLTGLCLWLLVPMLHMRWREPRTIFFLAFALALAPFHTSISQGQVTIPVTALVLLALRFDLKDRPLPAGVFLGLAVALKPQTVLLFAMLPLFRTRWRATAWAAATAAVTGILGAGRLFLTHTNWLHTLRSNLAGMGRGGHDDPMGAEKFMMVNLQPLLHTFMSDRWLAAALSLGSVVLVGAAVLLILRRRRGLETEFTIYAAVAVLSLLVLYNRIYGATMLVLPLAWAVASLRSAQLRRTAILVLVLILPFIVPGPAALDTWASHGQLPIATDRWWWRDIVLMHQNYALVLLALTMLYAAWRIRKPSTGS
jgi:hypothetical protein